MSTPNTVQNAPNTSNKKSAALWVVMSVAIVVLLLAAVLVGKGLLNKNSGGMSNKQLAQEYADVLPDKTQDEIIDILNREMTDEEKQQYEEIINDPNYLPEVAEIVEETETGYIYLDADGNQHEFIDPFLTMTDAESDELSKYYEDVNSFLPGNTPPSSDTTQEPDEPTEITGIYDGTEQGPFDGYDDPSLIDQDSENVYEGAYIETETPRYDWEDQGSGENPHGDYDRGYTISG